MTVRPASRGAGRRRGTPDTRGAILDAARRLFAERGYDATTLRGIARAAGVDPALAHAPHVPRPVGVRGQPRRLMGFVRSVTTNEAAVAMMREAFGRVLFDREAPYLSGPDVRLRLTAAMSQLVGLAVARYVVGIEPLASAGVDDLVPVFAPTLQHYLDG